MKVRFWGYLLVGLALIALPPLLLAQEQKRVSDDSVSQEQRRVSDDSVAQEQRHASDDSVAQEQRRASDVSDEQEWSIIGYVTDKKSREPLKDALVLVVGSSTIHAETNVKGAYSLNLPLHDIELEFYCHGYKTERIALKYVQRKRRVDVELEPLEYTLIDAVILAEKENFRISRPDMGLERITSQESKKIPTLLGEPDVIKALQLSPGVQSTSEGSSGFIVRGGSPDQNLVLFDRATVYNPSHLMGFFSVFNNDAISDVQLYKGDIPASYGGRLSSLLDVGGREGSSDYDVSGGIGLIASRLAVSGPVGDDLTFLTAMRRTYADLLLRLSKDTTVNNATINFYDLNGKMRWRVNERNALTFTLYNGRDKFGTHGIGFTFGNSIGVLAWNHRFSPRFSLSTTASGTMYQYEFKGDMSSMEGKWAASIKEANVRTDFFYRWNAHTISRFGWSVSYQWFQPGDITVRRIDDEMQPPNRLNMAHRQALLNTLYFSNEHKLFNERLLLRAGLRLTRFDNVGPTTQYYIDDDYNIIDKVIMPSGKFYHHEYGWEPRLALSLMLSDQTSVKASYSRTLQYVHLLSFSSTGSPLDVWIPVNPSIKPQVAHQYAIGFFSGLFKHKLQASVELFYKDLKHVLDFKDHPNVLLYEKVESEVRFGSGIAYGTEWMLKKEDGDLSGWISYTWLRSYRTIDRVNNNERYSAPSDRPHNVSVVLNFQFPFFRRLEVSANWIYTTGQPFVMPEGRFLFFGEFIPVYSARNAYRMPDYHRMDCSLIVHLSRRGSKFKNDINLSAYNLYGRKNPWMINYRLSREGNQYAEMTYLFGVVPSITWNFNF